MRRRAWLTWLLLAAVTAPVTAQHVWLDTERRPLPFADDDALLEFLRDATVIDEHPIGTGINQSVRLTLEKDSIQAHAIFREADDRKRNASVDGRQYAFFADSYKFECAAYVLSRLIEMPRVPPAALRQVGRRHGSAQIWLEDTLDEDASDFEPPSPAGWAMQVWDMVFFDNLIYNADRNSGNVLVDENYDLWMIDHTRAFQFKNELLDDKIVRVPRRSWERLLALSDAELDAALHAYLTPLELRALRVRRDELVLYVDSLVAQRGESAVFY